jgi:integrase
MPNHCTTRAPSLLGNRRSAADTSGPAPQDGANRHTAARRVSPRRVRAGASQSAGLRPVAGLPRNEGYVLAPAAGRKAEGWPTQGAALYVDRLQLPPDHRGDRPQDFRPFTFHHLRHSHAVQWLKSGRSIYVLKDRLGHTSVKTTEIYLAFLTPNEKQIAMFGRADTGTKTGTRAAV